MRFVSRILTVAAAFCLSTAISGGQPAQAQTITLNGAVQFNDDHAFNKALLKFEELVKKFDKDGDGKLNDEERRAAKEALQGQEKKAPDKAAKKVSADKEGKKVPEKAVEKKPVEKKPVDKTEKKPVDKTEKKPADKPSEKKPADKPKEK